MGFFFFLQVPMSNGIRNGNISNDDVDDETEDNSASLGKIFICMLGIIIKCLKEFMWNQSAVFFTLCYLNKKSMFA